MCGGQSTTTQSTTIPPEVLARYNAVNARAEDVSKQPFQRYTGQFVAPINQQQMAGIGGINQAANMAQGQMGNAQQVLNQSYQQAQPYMQQALGTAGAAYGQAQNQLGQAQGYLNNAASQGQIYGGQAYTPIAGALGAANPYMQTATQMVGGGLGAAAPMMGAAEGYLGGGTQAVNAQEFGQAQINKYMSPYMRNVVEAQQALQQQESAAQRSALNSQAIGAGAFGGDRAGIAQANLARQQSLANQATLGNLLQQGYGQAAGMFQQQQGVNLAAQQANRAAQQFGSQQAANLAQQRYAQQMGVGQQMAALGQQQFGQNIAAGQALSGLGQQMYQQGLGASQAAQGLAQAGYGMGAQQGAFQQGIGSALYGMGTQQAMNQAALAQQQQAAALQGAQAQIGAGTLQQQTQQAEDTAKYQQFLQERGYDFQVAQFLANIAMGTGALSGSTTTTTGPNSFFSDRRLKKDIKEIGETHDGLPIYSFKYKGGDDQQRIGVMADEAREKHPDAVKRVGGVDAVDYEKIANRASEGGGVLPHRAREGFVEGGHVSPEDLSAIIAMQKQFLGPRGEAGLYGQSAQNLPGQKGIVPQASLPVARPPRHAAPPQQQSGMQQAMSQLGQAEKLGETLLGDKGLFTSKGLPARAARSVGVMPQEQKQPAEQAQDGSKQPPAGSAKQMVQDYSKPKTADVSPTVGGIKPEAAPQETIIGSAPSDVIYPKDSDIFVPETVVARGGVIPHKTGGGGAGHLREGVLPYQSALKYGPEETNEAESGEQYSLLGADKGSGKSGSGGSGIGQLSSLISAGTAAAKAAPAAIEGLTALFAMLPFSDERVKSGMKRVGELDNGQPVYKYRIGDGPTQLGLSAQNVSKYGDPSAVHRDRDGLLHLDYDRATREYGGGVRPTFQDGGDAEKKNPLVEYRDYMIEKGLEPHVAAGIAGNIAKESNGNPTIWGDNDNSFGLFQKNIRGELPAYQKWAAENKRDMNDPKAQIDHVIERLNGPYANVYKQMRESNDPAQAAYQFAVGYERPVPATARYDERMKIAAQLAGGEYTGKGVAPQGEPRRQVAGAEYEDGKSYVDGKRVYDGGIAPPTEYRTGKPYESWGDFLTSRQFIVPVLSGLGAMAASPSRYFGGAALQGLGAAAQSYANMEKPITEGEERRAITAGTQATTQGTLQANIQKSLQVLADGSRIVWVKGPSGPTFMRFSDYSDLKSTGREPPLLGTVPPNAEQIVQQSGQGGSGGVSTGTPAAAPAGTPAGTAGATPPAGAKPQPNAAIPLAPEAATAAREERNVMDDGGPAAAANAEMSKSWYLPTVMRGTAARGTIKGSGDLAQNISESAQGQGFDAPGFAAKIRAQYASFANTFLRSIGEKPISSLDERDEINRKLALVQAEMNAVSGNQRADATLDKILSAQPTLEMNPQAAAKLAADLWVARQRDIDKDLYRERWGKASNNSFARTDSYFQQEYSLERYQKEQALIQRIILEDPSLLKDMRSGKFKPEQIERYFEKKIGENYPQISRYFVTGAK